MMRRLLILATLFVWILSSSGTARADDKTLENIFKNAYYGAAIGGLLGTAIMIFSDRPADHFNYIAYGLAGGVIAGTFYGMANPSRAFTEIGNGHLTFEFPRLEIRDPVPMSSLERRKPVLAVPVFKLRF